MQYILLVLLICLSGFSFGQTRVYGVYGTGEVVFDNVCYQGTLYVVASNPESKASLYISEAPHTVSNSDLVTRCVNLGKVERKARSK